MNIVAVDYAVERGLTDALWLYKGEVDLSATRQYWQDEVATIMDGGRRSLRDFCRHIDDVAEAVPNDIGCEKRGWFLRPSDIIERTRGAIAIMKVLEDVKNGKRRIDPRDTEVVAKEAGLGAAEDLHNIVEQLFVVKEGSWEYLLDTCGLGKGYEMDLEFSDWAEIDDIIRDSLAWNALPERDGGKQLIQHVRKALGEDLGRAVSHFQGLGWGISLCGLNQYSYYFRQFGIHAYLLWFDEDKAAIVKAATDHPQIARELREIFSFSSKLNPRREMMPKWRSNDDSLSETIMNLKEAGAPKTEMWSIICETYSFPYSADKVWNQFNVEKALKIIHFYRSRRIPASPLPSYFFITPAAFDHRQQKMDAALEFCDFLKVPEKVRAFIAHDLTSREELEERAYAFERHGLKPEYYAPFLHYDLTRQPMILHQIFSVVCAERGTEATRQHPRQRKKLKRLSAIASPNRVAGHLYINRHGVPHVKIDNQEVSPESIACKVRLCVEAGIAVPSPNILERFTYEDLAKKLPVLRAGITYGLRRRVYEDGELASFLQERGLELPQYMRDEPQRFNEVSVMERIREIENYGIPFTRQALEQRRVHWSWINMAGHERMRKMYKSWAYIHDEERRGALCAQYGIEMDELPVSLSCKLTDTLWRFFMLIKEAGLISEDVSLAQINMLSPERFRGHLNDLLLSMQTEATLPVGQLLYTRKFGLAENMEKHFGWEEPARLFDGMGEDEFARIEHLLGNGLEVSEIKHRLEENHRLKEECVKLMLFTQYSYEKIETALAAGNLRHLYRRLMQGISILP